MNKNKIFLILVFIFIISVGAVSANENVNNNTEIDISQSIDVSDNYDVSSVSTEHIITSSNYNTYFNNDGSIKTSSGINDGDTIRLSGTFDKKNFVISKNLTISGDNNNQINNGSITVLNTGSGSKVLNLNIDNFGEDLQGIFLLGASNCIVDKNHILTKGQSSFAICVDQGSQYNNITNNFLKSEGFIYNGNTKSVCPFVMGTSHYNYIANNYIECNDANGIYFSKWGSGRFIGGECNYNIVFNNTVKCMIIPTSWCYGIQLMGSNNKAIKNIVIGTYRGISLPGSNGTVRDNKLINLTGKDYRDMSLVGGDYGIFTGEGAIVENNNLTNSLLTGAGIYVGTNSQVKDNNVEVKGSSYGVQAGGNDVKIVENTIKTNNGACVYEAGAQSGLVVDNNVLVSNTGIGVLLKKSSNSKFPSDITITNNNITTSNEYAIDTKEADKDSYVIKNNNVGSSKILSPNGEITPGNDFEFNGKVYNVTPDSFHAFFDEKGNIINPDVNDGDILNFSGDFKEVNMIISSSIKLTGINPTFNNTKINVTSGDVWIENFTINNENSSYINPWGIYASNIKNLMIVNNKINVVDKNAAYAIYLFSVNNAIVKNNTLSSSGDYLTYTLLGYGLEDSIIENNNIKTIGTGEIHAYEQTKCIDGVHSVNEIYRTYGMLFITSSNNAVSNNNVVVTSKVTTPQAKINGSLSTNSLVGIDAYFDCDNNVFNGNNITINANDNYIYGMGVLGAETGSSSSSYSTNNNFTNNNINIKSHNMGTGIIVGYNSQKGKIANNNITINSDNVGYGITLEFGKEFDVNNNNINLSSDVCYIIEGFEADNNVISNNSLYGKGCYVYGIAGYRSNNNVISNNSILAKGDASKPVNQTNHADALGVGNAGIIFKNNSTNNKILANHVISDKDFAVNLRGSSNNTVANNFLIGEKYSGNDAVLNSANNNVTDNFANIFTDNKVFNSTASFNGNLILTAISGIKDDNTTVVSFYINGKFVGKANTINGVATLNVRLDSNYVPGEYDIQAKFARDNYGDATSNGILLVTKTTPIITLKDSEGKKGTSVILEAIVKDASGNPLGNVIVKFYRNDRYIGEAVTDNNGVAKFKYEIPASIPGDSVQIFAEVDSDNCYNNNSANATLKFTNLTQTQIISDDFVMYYKNGTALKAILADINGKAIKNQEIIITINGVDYKKTTDENGLVKVSINLIPGDYLISLKYNGNNQYYNSSKVVNVKVLSVISEGKDITLYFRNGTRYSVKVLDSHGNPAVNQKIKFNINGKFYDKITDKDGFASLAINLNPGTYIITAETPNGDKMSNNITVLPTIYGENVVKYFRNGTQYHVKVLDGQGNPAAGQNVTFNINGVFYHKVTDENGVATLNINLNAGVYSITASFNGLNVNNRVEVLPILSASDLTKKFSERKYFEAKALDAHGNPAAGQNVTFNINGVFYHKVTDADGIARLAINLSPGKYIITSEYNNYKVANTVTVQNK